MGQRQALFLFLLVITGYGRLTFSHVSRLVTVHVEDGFVAPFVHGFTRNRFIFNPSMIARAEASWQYTAEKTLLYESEKVGRAFTADHPAHDRGKAYRRPTEGSSRDTSSVTLQLKGVRGPAAAKHVIIHQTKRTLFNFGFFFGKKGEIINSKLRFQAVCSEILSKSFQNSGFCVFLLPTDFSLEGRNWLATSKHLSSHGSQRSRDMFAQSFQELVDRIQSQISLAIETATSDGHGRRVSQTRLKKALRNLAVFWTGNSSEISPNIIAHYLERSLGQKSTKKAKSSFWRRLIGFGLILYLLKDFILAQSASVTRFSFQKPPPLRPKPSSELWVVVGEPAPSTPTPFKPKLDGLDIILE